MDIVNLGEAHQRAVDRDLRGNARHVALELGAIGDQLLRLVGARARDPGGDRVDRAQLEELGKVRRHSPAHTRGDVVAERAEAWSCARWYSIFVRQRLRRRAIHRHVAS